MRGLWLEAGKARLRTDLPTPRPPAGEVRVRVLRAGICNTDLELQRGYYPYAGVLGHEFVGVVDDPEAPEAWQGARVVGEINAVCRRCVACTQGRPTHCVSRTVLGIVGRDGAFADFLLLPLENLHRVPPGVTDDGAVFTEPLAAALEILQQVHVAPEGRAVIVGDGKLGLLVAQVLALTGCRLTVLGHHPTRLRDCGWPGIEVAEAVEDGGFDVAVDCTGNPEGFAAARRALRARGTLVMKSTYAGDLNVDAAGLVVDEITLVGSRCGPFAPALRLLRDGRVDVGPLVAARYPLDEAARALEHAAQPGVLKVLLDATEAR